jgi:hypothetical protein
VPRDVLKEVGPIAPSDLENTDFSGKKSGLLKPNTDLSRKVGDDWVTKRLGSHRRRAVSADKEALQRRTISVERWRRPAGEPNTDLSRKDYRPLAQAIPTSHATQYRSLAQVLATYHARNTDHWSKNTDPPRKKYRPLAQAEKENVLQIQGFSPGFPVPMYVVFLLNVVLLQTGEA